MALTILKKTNLSEYPQLKYQITGTINGKRAKHTVDSNKFTLTYYLYIFLLSPCDLCETKKVSRLSNRAKPHQLFAEININKTLYISMKDQEYTMKCLCVLSAPNMNSEKKITQNECSQITQNQQRRTPKCKQTSRQWQATMIIAFHGADYGRKTKSI